MIKIIFILLFVARTLMAQEISIAVAANVSYAIDDLITEFQKTNPDIKVRAILGSSAKLTAQIKNGAPFGLFMAANMMYPKALYSDAIASTEPVIYAQGTLAYFSVQKRNFTQRIEVLKDKSIVKIAIANPKTAPYGKAAEEALKNAKIYDSAKSKLIFAESASQTVAYALKAADIGLIAKSALYSRRMSQYKEGINWATVNPKLYTPINQGVVLLKYAGNSKAYKAFYDFILSDKAKVIFKSYGYMVK